MALRARILRYFTYALLLAVAALAVFTLQLDVRVRNEFEGRRFALPARIYARPLELHAGLRIAQADVEDELRELGYRDAPREGESGWFHKDGDALDIAVRAFVFWDGAEPARRLRVAFDAGQVASVRDGEGRDLGLARLEPLPIGGIYPAGNEDRVLVRLGDVPTYLNEIYLGQDRDRAIHGVGLAAQFYFGKEARHLTLAESALLVAMVKGPAVYDPRRHPARAFERRNLVLRET